MSRPIPGTDGTSDLADWLPLLGSILNALRSAGDPQETTSGSRPGADPHQSQDKTEESKG